MWSERWRSGLVLLLCVAFLTTGCDVDLTGDDPGATGEVSYDLTEPPTRDEVGMQPGRKVVSAETETGRTVTVALPEGRQLTTEVNLVTFDSYGAGLAAETADPTGMDMHTPRVELAAAVELLRDSLRQIGGAEELAESWRQAAESTTGTAIVRSENVPHQVGFLTVRVQGRYNPVDDRATVAYILFWG